MSFISFSPTSSVKRETFKGFYRNSAGSESDCSSVLYVSTIFTRRVAEAASSLQVPAGDGRRGPLREDVGPEEALQSHLRSQTLSDQ